MPQQSNKMTHLYLFLAIVGAIIPLSQFFQFLEIYGLNMKLFFEQLFVNKISSFFAMDVIISAVVTVAFIIYESARLKIRGSYYCFLGLFLAGVSCGLPWFLFLREKAILKSRPLQN